MAREASHVWDFRMVMSAPVSTKNLTGIPFTDPLTYKSSLSAPTASVLIKGKVGLRVDWSVGLWPLNSTVSRFPDIPAAVEKLASITVYATHPRDV